MKIESSTLDLKSTHKSQTKLESQTTLNLWDQNTNVELTSKQDELHISALAQELYQRNVNLTSQNSLQDVMLEETQALDVLTTKTSVLEDKYLPELSPKDKMKLLLVMMMVKYMRGNRTKDINIDSLDPFAKWKDIRSPQHVNCNNSLFNIEQAKQLRQPQQTQTQPQSQPQPQLLGWGMDIEYHELRHETEQTSFTTEGIIKTQDGKSIAVSMSLTMSRNSTTEVNLSFKAGDAVKDPLVINFRGGTADLTSEKYDFDLDSNGIVEKISFVGPSGGFLALDKNGDGVINDGRELFGAITGQGFKELANYDSDKNNWIDENDQIFKNLRIWSKDQNGGDHLYDLTSLGIGAIYLGYTDTPFSLKNSDHRVDGYVKSTGIYLRENGQVGTVQQLDLTV